MWYETYQTAQSAYRVKSSRKIVPFLKKVSAIYGMIWGIIGSVRYIAKMIRQLFDDSFNEIFLKNNNFFLFNWKSPDSPQIQYVMAWKTK